MSIGAGDVANASLMTADVHVGTHVDAPLHFVDGGADLEAIPLDNFIGPATVVDLSARTPITAGDLDRAQIAQGVERLLIRANQQPDWFERPFNPAFNALTQDAATWIGDRELKLVGIDYLSIQRFDDGPETHQILLGAGVCILEGLDLSEVSPGDYELVCLPLRLQVAEAAPARAILRSLD